MHLPLPLFLRDDRFLLVRQVSALGPRLLGTQVKWYVLLAFVQLTERMTLVGVGDSIDAGDRFANVVAGGERHPSAESPTTNTRVSI